MPLVDYDLSSTSEDDSDVSSHYCLKSKEKSLNEKTLPTAEILLGTRLSYARETQSTVTTDPNKHEGRVRSFQHERGNWASYVYLEANADYMEDLQDRYLQLLKGISLIGIPSQQLHISLSRTVVLPYHVISSFSKSLEDAMAQFSSFTISFDRLSVYVNEENTRTFLALQANKVHGKEMQQILSAVNSVMRRHRLAEFYKDASFHVSFLWCLGDRSALLTARMKTLQSKLPGISAGKVLTLQINTVCCKCGNKQFKFKLK